MSDIQTPPLLYLDADAMSELFKHTHMPFALNIKLTCRALREAVINHLGEKTTTSKLAMVVSSVNMLKWARTCGCPWGPTVCARAAEGGHLEVLKWARLNMQCPWDKDTAYMAAKGGQLEVIKWLRVAGCPWESAQVCFEAVGGGHLNVIKWLLLKPNLTKRLTPSEWKDLYSLAARGDHLEVLKWLCAERWPHSTNREHIVEEACHGGHLGILKWAHTKSFSFESQTANQAAAEGGHLHCLKYLHERGCAWDAYTCLNAAAGGHLDCIKYARERGCPWDEYTCVNAAAYGHLDCLVWARERGCPWDREKCARAATDPATFRWIKAQPN